MSKCPYCGAQLQDEASFCTYCMRSLNKKREVTPTFKNKRPTVIFTVAFICIALLAGIAALVLATKEIAAPEEESSQQEPYTKWTDEEPESEDGGIDGFIVCAVVITGRENCSELWDPDGFVKTRTETDVDGARWTVYNIPSRIDGVNINVYKCDSTGEMMTSVTGLTDETAEEGKLLTEIMTSSVYVDRYSDTDLAEIAINKRDATYVEAAPEECNLTVLGLLDHVENRYDEGTGASLSRGVVDVGDIGGFEGQKMIFDRRTRVHNGRNEYDIIVLHSMSV